MKLLAIETATEACSIAVLVDGAVIERFEIAPRRHTELALPWAAALLAEAGISKSQLDAIAVGRGPGAFTGVRLAIALAQGIALALDRPLLPVSTLAALAMQAITGSGSLPVASGPDPVPDPVPEGDRVVAAIDARMGEIYVASFQRANDGVVATSGEIVIVPGAYAPPGGVDWHGVGTGFAAAEGALATRLHAQLASMDATALPHAADVARLGALAFARGETIAPDHIEPAYLRNNVALTMAQQQALKALRRLPLV